MIYVDTSALLKRYIAEAISSRFDAFFLQHAPLAISRLTYVEMRCALAQRKRAGQIDALLEERALRQFLIDLRDNALHLHPVEDTQVGAAFDVIENLSSLPLRTLDAVHLSIAGAIAATDFATADKQQATAAAALDFTVHRFY